MASSPADPLHHVESWVFDLDNTLYSAKTDLFAQIDRRMGEYIGQHLDLPPVEARTLQKRLFREHGTTLRGLMNEHAVDPGPFLKFVHDIDVSVIGPSPVLAAALAELPGRKLIFTNGSVRHADQVLARLGVANRFDGIFDIVAADYVPKPDPISYRTMLDRYGLAPESTVMVEDMARNLLPAHHLGMTTVWVRTPSDWGQPLPGDGHIDIAIGDTADWLAAVVTARRT